jgi:hypothetical protein
VTLPVAGEDVGSVVVGLDVDQEFIREEYVSTLGSVHPLDCRLNVNRRQLGDGSPRTSEVASHERNTAYPPNSS